MSNSQGDTEVLREQLEDQHLDTDHKSLYRRDSEASESSEVSTLANTYRRPRVTGSSHPEGSEARARPRYPKVRTGCDTCKQRKIKCDERKPHCRNCMKSGRQCLGYHPPMTRYFEPLHTDSQIRSNIEEDAKTLEYFKNHTAIRLASYRPLNLSLDFWQKVVPDLAADNAALRYAMLTLAATQQEYEGNNSELLSPEGSQSPKHYGHAVRELRAAIGPEATISNGVALLCCLLLTLYDVWHFGVPFSYHKVFGGFEHVFGGLKICQFVKQTSPSKSPLPETTSVDGKTMIFAFEHLADCASVLLDDVDLERSVLLQEFGQSLDTVLPPLFMETGEGMAVMDNMLRHISKLDPDAESTVLNMHEHLDLLSSVLEQSLAVSDPGDAVTQFDFRLLLVYHRVASVLLNSHSDAFELNDLGCMDEFVTIVTELEDMLQNESKTPSLMFSKKRVWMGVIPPLFLVATRSDDSSLRKRALVVLHCGPHHDHLWTSCTAFQIARYIDQLLDTDRSVRLCNIKFNAADSVIELGYKIAKGRGDSLVRSTITWHQGGNIDPTHPPQTFSMPEKVIKICGYAVPMLTCREIECHCEDAVR